MFSTPNRLSDDSEPQDFYAVDFNSLVQQGAAHAWLYIPVAILLGALHGLEPGHSKTMMAAFIIAVRGTIPQAVLLGISAAFSHSLIIWLLAGLALQVYGGHWNAEQTEPYFQLASAAIILGLAAWMFFRTRRELHAAHHRDHDHGHTHAHSELFVLDLGDGKTGVERPRGRPCRPSSACALRLVKDCWQQRM